MAEKHRKLNILFAAFECDPFFKSGGLGDVAGTLPAYVNSTKFDVRVVLPKLSVIPKQFRDKMVYVTNFTVPLGWRNAYCGLFRLRYKSVDYYFLDNEYYFKRDKAYGEYDDGERMAFFSKALLEAIPYMPNFAPDILHCNDWHTAMAPVFLREQYMQSDVHRNIRTIFTVHNLKFQGQYSAFLLGDVLGLMGSSAEPQLRQPQGGINFLQGALHYSDRITTVSPSYANEICTPDYGEGLDWLFRERRSVLSGILNGIDVKIWDPATDRFIPAHYDRKAPENKDECKQALQEELGLAPDTKKPLFALISRLTEQKGLDLLANILPQLMQRDLQLVILGVGAPQYEQYFKQIAFENSAKMNMYCAFNTAVSHELYAAADVLLMPSRFEPCGLSQMMAMRYGTLPLVRETGGLRDSVKPCNEITGEGTGFSFWEYKPEVLLKTIDYSLKVWYEDPKAWKKLQQQAMAEDFSWKQSALKYRTLYRSLAE